MLQVLYLFIFLCFLWPMSSFSEDECSKTIQNARPVKDKKKPATVLPGERTSSFQMVLNTPLTQVDFGLTAEEQALFVKFLEDKSIRTVRDLKDKTTKPYLRVFLSREIVYKVMITMYDQYNIVIPEF